MKYDIGRFIPLDKSWMIRMGVLDVSHGRYDIVRFLEDYQRPVSDDLQALLRCARAWKSGRELDVGESGTLYRFLQYYSWKRGLNKEFRLQGTLQERAASSICDDPEIVSLPIEELRKLDDGTSQWASARYLAGDRERVPDPQPKLKLTYEAVAHWEKRRKQGKCWVPRYDETIRAQALAYLGYLRTGKMKFVPQHSEDYCFARAFNLITPKQGAKIWPQLVSHESNRFTHLEDVLAAAKHGELIDSKDHRVVQAVVMRQRARKRPVKIADKNVVGKSWPEFWDFIVYGEVMHLNSRQ